MVREEDELQFAATRLFRERLKKTIWFAVPNGEFRNIVTARKLRKMGVRPGVADYIMLHASGGYQIAYALELKREKGGRLSDDQKGFRDAWQAMGGHYEIAKTIGEIEMFIEMNGLD